MITPKPHTDTLHERVKTKQSGLRHTTDETNRCLDLTNASFDLILSRIAGVSETDQNLVFLKLAERLLESAGYGSAGVLPRHDVVELMLISAQVERIATTLTAQGAPTGAGVNRDV